MDVSHSKVGVDIYFPCLDHTFPVELSLGCNMCGDTGLELSSHEVLGIPKGKKILVFSVFRRKLLVN